MTRIRFEAASITAAVAYSTRISVNHNAILLRQGPLIVALHRWRPTRSPVNLALARITAPRCPAAAWRSTIWQRLNEMVEICQSPSGIMWFSDIAFGA